ncbi:MULTISPECIES: FadR/GntR family transcriptional regulator [Paraburkholderia]|jgi:DNA-binding FadR family transcriptional regulator|uniref:FCD domain-containing protein n=1 Tax=Paraburkholderia dipogonis TaxID=1211383 RepID=A0ABW9AT38_9BURK|nr:FCD domain-containing protein [Paraburkholderia sp. BL9I2N2]TCK91219.1 GntR family transcriptional regulator [Paraburkholderia sp. BL9I2N2]
MNHGFEASLVKRVVNQLVTGIINGDYDGDVLPPQVILSKKHGVSRAIMREAISILVSRRMLDVRTKTGTRITPAKDWLIIDHEVAEWRLRATPDPEYLHGLIEFRKLVDPRAAAFAATRANRHQRIAITAMYQTLQRASGNYVAEKAAEDALQAAIVDASGDALLSQMGSIVRMGLRAMQAISHVQALAYDTRVADYGKVVRAIEAGDAGGAKAAMMQLISHSADQLLGETV